MRESPVYGLAYLRVCIPRNRFHRRWPLFHGRLETFVQTKQPRLNFHPRFVHVTPILLKKGGKSSKGKDISTPLPSVDPLDFSDLENGIVNGHSELREILSKLRAGGRFNTELVENLRLSLEKGSRETVRLGDLAQVIPRGRILNVLVGEVGHIKAVSSAIQSSDLSLTPQSDPQNPLQLNITLPPPTTESRNQVVKTADQVAEKAATNVKNMRQAHQKRLRSMQISKAARPDDLRKAGEKMEKIVEKAITEIKAISDAVKKKLESG